MKKILVAVPAYNCECQIGRVINQFASSPKEIFSEFIIIDNRSTDNTVHSALNAIALYPKLKIKLFRNDFNYGLGGSHKVAFNYCLKKDFDGVVILHGDDQGSLADFYCVMKTLKAGDFDSVLGSRFMKGSFLVGYPKIRIFGNYVFNSLYSLATMKKISDMGSGLNYYDRNLLKDRLYIRMPDDLTFNNAYLLTCVARKKNIKFVPVSWREEDQISNAKLWSQSVKLFRYLFLFMFFRALLVSSDFRTLNIFKYSYKIIKFGSKKGVNHG
jgi:glycosyltransferase involved in cell wall biosynthesis